MKIAYFDAFSGISGDMVVGALLDAGVSLPYLRSQLKKLGIGGYRIGVKNVKQNSIAAKSFVVTETARQKPRDYARIKRIIKRSSLGEAVKSLSLEIFTKIAEAEAKVHDSSVEEVHFHEIGGVDSIVDIVGAAIGFDRLGIERFASSPIPTGGGFTKSSHGVMPVPAPATLHILRGVPVYGGDAEFELTTPTGAAIAVALCGDFGPMPPMKPMATGFGAGKKKRSDGAPNLLRIVIGEAADTTIAVKNLTVMETNIDDATPESLGFAVKRLLGRGALDVWVSPITMKKGRQAFCLSVLGDAAHAEELRRVILENTPTLGIRQYHVKRFELERKVIKVKTKYGGVRVKVAVTPEGGRRFKPEFDDVSRLAEKNRVGFKEVFRAAIIAAAKRKTL